LRITAGGHSAITILQPALAKLLPDNPGLDVEIIVDYGLTDSFPAITSTTPVCARYGLATLARSRAGHRRSS